jgi:CubicO group peptidase (beta-lactamase class C family)
MNPCHSLNLMYTRNFSVVYGHRLRALWLLAMFSVSMLAAIGQKKLSVRIDSLMQAHKDFSGVILTGDFGKVTYYKAFGYRDYAAGVKMDKQDIFELASISKTFTAMAVMMLQKEGKLHMDDSLSAFIDLPYPGVTIRHLLNHTSGLPDYQDIMDKHWDKSREAGNEDNIEYLRKYAPPVQFRPGDKYAYSNTGYMLLATVVEKASGEDFIAFCRNRIFRPLRMRKTDIRTLAQKAATKDFAIGHVWVAEKQRYVRADSFPSSNYTIWLGNRKGPGRVSSTARDLLLWDQALYGHKLLPQQDIRKAFEPAKLNNDSLSNYGFGWMLEALPVLGITVWHSGDNPGYRTRLMRYTGARRTLIVLNNNEYPKMSALMNVLESMLQQD